MQAIARTRTQGTGFNQLKTTLIAAGLLITIVASVAVFQSSQDSNSTAADSGTFSVSTVSMQQFYAHKEARQDGLELAAAALANNAIQAQTLQRYVAHKEASMDAEFSAIAAQPTQSQRVATDKEARLAAQEQSRSDLAARSMRQETMQRYYAHKEAQLNALP